MFFMQTAASSLTGIYARDRDIHSPKGAYFSDEGMRTMWMETSIEM